MGKLEPLAAKPKAAKFFFRKLYKAAGTLAEVVGGHRQDAGKTAIKLPRARGLSRRPFGNRQHPHPPQVAEAADSRQVAAGLSSPSVRAG